jgi:iron complex transport system substrate-binding protein
MLRRIIFVILTLGLLLAACSPAVTPQPTVVATEAPVLVEPSTTPIPVTPTTEPIVFTDGLGRSVTLAAPAQRIVSMAPSNTELLFAVGAGAQVVGRDEFSDFPEDAKALPSVGGSMGQYSNEQIAVLNPDLVLAGGINTPEQVKSLEDLGLTVFYLGNPLVLDELYVNIETVGALTGQAAGATTLNEDLRKRVDAIDKLVAGASEKPVVFYEVDASNPSKPYTAGPGTFIDTLIQRAGGQNLPGLTDMYPQVSLEVVVDANPAIILLGDALYGTTPETVAQRAGWNTLSAVTNGKVFPFDDDLVSRPGPRLVDGLEALAKVLHPELFK